MKSITKLIAISMLASNAQAASLTEVQRTTDRLADQLDFVGHELTDIQLLKIQTHLDEAIQIIRNRGSIEDFGCFPSQRADGLFYLAKWSQSNQAVGPYFSSQENCKLSLSNIFQNMLCFESKSKAPKAFVGNVDKNPSSLSGLVGLYYDDFNLCVHAIQKRVGSRICMQSSRHAGKWYLSDLFDRPNLNLAGGYFNSFEACQVSLN